MTLVSHSIAARMPGKTVPLNVLYATDFSRTAGKAFLYAAEFARRFGSRFSAVHVRTAAEYLGARSKSRAEIDADFENKENALRSVLRSALPNLETEVLSLRGSVCKQLESLIREKNIGLLVLGTRGRSGLKKVLLGSVAETAVRRAPCPVLTVGPQAPSEPPFEGKFREMVYATDLSAASAAAVPYVLQLANEQEASLTLLHAIEKYPDDTAMRSDQIDASIVQRMEEMVRGELVKGMISYFVREGQPAKTILEVARGRHADLIVLGTKKSGNRAQEISHLPFTIAHKVIAQAKCAVLTIRS
jgi:nucleotide-binding universal stress UspA family protein